jgi:hypothetical protein
MIPWQPRDDALQLRRGRCAAAPDDAPGGSAALVHAPTWCRLALTPPSYRGDVLFGAADRAFLASTPTADVMRAPANPLAASSHSFLWWLQRTSRELKAAKGCPLAVVQQCLRDVDAAPDAAALLVITPYTVPAVPELRRSHDAHAVVSPALLPARDGDMSVVLPGDAQRAVRHLCRELADGDAPMASSADTLRALRLGVAAWFGSACSACSVPVHAVAGQRRVPRAAVYRVALRLTDALLHPRHGTTSAPATDAVRSISRACCASLMPACEMHDGPVGDAPSLWPLTGAQLDDAITDGTATWALPAFGDALMAVVEPWMDSNATTERAAFLAAMRPLVFTNCTSSDGTATFVALPSCPAAGRKRPNTASATLGGLNHITTRFDAVEAAVPRPSRAPTHPIASAEDQFIADDHGDEDDDDDAVEGQLDAAVTAGWRAHVRTFRDATVPRSAPHRRPTSASLLASRKAHCHVSAAPGGPPPVSYGLERVVLDRFTETLSRPAATQPPRPSAPNTAVVRNVRLAMDKLVAGRLGSLENATRTGHSHRRDDAPLRRDAPPAGVLLDAGVRRTLDTCGDAAALRDADLRELLQRRPSAVQRLRHAVDPRGPAPRRDVSLNVPVPAQKKSTQPTGLPPPSVLPVRAAVAGEPTPMSPLVLHTAARPMQFRQRNR